MFFDAESPLIEEIFLFIVYFYKRMTFLKGAAA